MQVYCIPANRSKGRRQITAQKLFACLHHMLPGFLNVTSEAATIQLTAALSPVLRRAFKRATSVWLAGFSLPSCLARRKYARASR